MAYMPCADQDLLRDWAEPVRERMTAEYIDDAWIFLDAVDDFAQFGTKGWRERPQEPAKAPDPAAMGLMAFDLEAAREPVGPCTWFVPGAGTISPQFNATVPAQVIEESGRRILRFNAVLGQGFRSNLGRQLSADYTILFVGTPPQWRGGNDGTGWQLGPYRFTVSQSPSPRWNWGGAWCPATEGKRHVVVCEQKANGQLRILLDGVEVGVGAGAAIQPDGTMGIGNVDAMNSRPVKMDLERLVVVEGVDRAKSMAASRAYCDWHGIEWRAEE
jgi:hypothetical protein